jgi:hypothetical protein
MNNALMSSRVLENVATVPSVPGARFRCVNIVLAPSGSAARKLGGTPFAKK